MIKYFWNYNNKDIQVGHFQYFKDSRVLRLFRTNGKALVDIGIANIMPDLSLLSETEMYNFLLSFFDNFKMKGAEDNE
jgi:hypothetical protein